jgi:hypothetical protein
MFFIGREAEGRAGLLALHLEIESIVPRVNAVENLWR